MSNLLQFPKSSPGTDGAINSPPYLTPPKLGEELKQGAEGDAPRAVLVTKTDVRARPAPQAVYTWQTCSPEARRVLEHMRRATPRGAAAPWRSKTSVTPIMHLLADGIDEADLIDLIDGAAAYLAAGRQDARFWYPQNLFAGTSMQRWLADIASHEAELAKLETTDREKAEFEARYAEDRELARTARPAVRDLELHKLGRAIQAQARENEAGEELPADEELSS